MDNKEPGPISRTAEQELQDAEQLSKNIQNESWKEWPNHAAFEGLEEQRGPLMLRLEGRIPGWAAGSLYRTGPGQATVEDTPKGTHYVSHWFDGFAHTHKFDIHAKKDEDDITAVSYSSRRQSEEHVAQIKKMGWRCSTSFGQKADPCVGIFSKFMSLFVPRQLNNNVVMLPNHPGLSKSGPFHTQSEQRTGISKLYISTDHRAFQEVHPDTLEPLGFVDQGCLHPDLKGPLSCAHAQRDRETGDWFNFNLAMGRQATYRVFRVRADNGKTDILATISETDLPAAYIHSFFLTDSFIVLCLPSTHIAWNGLKIVWEKNILDALKPFDETRRCKWFVIDRKHGKGVVARFTTPAGFFFHSINAFEMMAKDEEGTTRTDIFLDHSMYDTSDILFGLYYDVILNRNNATKAYFDYGSNKQMQSRLVRYRFRMPLPGEEAENSIAEEVLSIPSPHSGELCTIHPGRAGQWYRYTYGTCTRGLSTFMDSLVKTDLETQAAILWRAPQAHTPGEPVFVPRPGGVNEDDGVLLSVVLDGTAQMSYLLCLNAKTMEELGRAEADFPIAMGFHGFHAPFL